MRRLGAHLVLIDESGALMMPLVRRSLAPRGETPVLKHKASHRDRVSLMAALTLSQRRLRGNLCFQTYPKAFVNSERAAAFVRALLQRLRGSVILLWDGGSMHKGDPIRELQRQFPRLALERLPPYAPELNPVEFLWKYLKYDLLPNFAPQDVTHLDGVLLKHLHQIKRSPDRIRSFWRSVDLPFD